MAITINTSISSLIVQSNLEKATNSLNQAMERLTPDYKINCMDYSVVKNEKIRLKSLGNAIDNLLKSFEVLKALGNVYALISFQWQLVRDLTEQALNGTYDSDSLESIQSEIIASLKEIDQIVANSDFKSLEMINDSMESIVFDACLYSDFSNQIELDESLFKPCDVLTLFTEYTTSGVTSIEEAAKLCTGFYSGVGEVTGAQDTMLKAIDKIINEISARVATLDSVRYKLESNIELIKIQSENIASSLSTLWDADIAEESSNYIQAQILQQPSAVLLTNAN